MLIKPHCPKAGTGGVPGSSGGCGPTSSRSDSIAGVRLCRTHSTTASRRGVLRGSRRASVPVRARTIASGSGTCSGDEATRSRGNRANVGESAPKRKLLSDDGAPLGQIRHRGPSDDQAAHRGPRSSAQVTGHHPVAGRLRSALHLSHHVSRPSQVRRGRP